ncbi:DUF5714 domain-containing protein [Raoultibacter massiliensis]|uniref:DUF5714 domain-containing protein n=1 Tax=Raoultibacter massiliensis TaxID=1852371 RepID=A0ABV1JAN1_9ACTN
MSIGLAVCLVCGSPLDYFEEAQEVTCHICGKKETGHSVCSSGHYVCDECHRAGGVEQTMSYCRASDSKDPIGIAMKIMDDKSIFPNGPEHHTLVGAALLTAYSNAGGEIDLDRALEELRARSLNVPGGTCGFWGTCGAAVSAGMYMSIVSGSTPMSREPWAQTTRLTARILDRLADLGGPRCCKRTSFTAIKTAVEYTDEVCGVSMELPEKIVCTHFARNRECLRADCPYFPSRQSGK